MTMTRSSSRVVGASHLRLAPTVHMATPAQNGAQYGISLGNLAETLCRQLQPKTAEEGESLVAAEARQSQPGSLILIRHGQSTWNLENR